MTGSEQHAILFLFIMHHYHGSLTAANLIFQFFCRCVCVCVCVCVCACVGGSVLFRRFHPPAALGSPRGHGTRPLWMGGGYIDHEKITGEFISQSK